MRKFLQILVVAALGVSAIGCSNSDDGLDYLKGSSSLWLGSVDSVNMSNFGSQLAVSGGNQNIVKASVDSTTLVLEGVNTGATTLFVTTDQVFIEMVVRVRGLVGYWGVSTNDKYGIAVSIEGEDTLTADRIAQIQSALVEQYSAQLAGSIFEFGPTLFVWSNGTAAGDGTWQLSGNSLVLTEGGVARTLNLEVYGVDRVRLAADIVESVKAQYPDDAVTGATLTFFLDRRIAM